MEKLDEVCKKYKLSDEEHTRIGNLINEIMLNNKEAVKEPIAIIDIAPPGSGKTGLNGLGVKQFNGNVVVINSDELKPFHPKIDEIAKLYPEYYTKVTNQESNPWTDNLFETAVYGKYNIIFEGTGRNLKLLRRMIAKMSNYRVIVRGMAVNELNCLISILERYEGQVNEKGWGRLVTLSHFYKAYEEMLDTIDQIEKLNITNSVEVYTRGNKPTEPRRIYNSNIKEFPTAKMAVVEGRQRDRKKANEYYNNGFDKRVIEEDNLLEIQEIIEKIESLYTINEIEDEKVK